MKDIVKTQRFYKQHFSQVEKSDGTLLEFNSIRAGIAFPNKQTPGLILTGGIQRGKEIVQIIAEEKFGNLSEALKLVNDFSEKFLLYALYFRNCPEAEAFGNFLQRENSKKVSIKVAAYTENLDFAVHLLGDFWVTLNF